jgi:hypothetical protein
MPAICANATNPRLLCLRPRDYGRADASPEICCREGEHVRDIFGGSSKRWSLSLAPSGDLPARLFFACFLAFWPDRGAAIAQNGRRHASSNSVIRHVIHNNCTGPAAWGPTLRANRNARTLLSARTRAQAVAKVASCEWSSTTTHSQSMSAPASAVPRRSWKTCRFGPSLKAGVTRKGTAAATPRRRRS